LESNATCAAERIGTEAGSSDLSDVEFYTNNYTDIAAAPDANASANASTNANANAETSTCCCSSGAKTGTTDFTDVETCTKGGIERAGNRARIHADSEACPNTCAKSSTGS
jgi:hypothetical protein